MYDGNPLDAAPRPARNRGGMMMAFLCRIFGHGWRMCGFTGGFANPEYFWICKRCGLLSTTNVNAKPESEGE